MNQDPPFKIGFIGSHGVGKTTLCYGLAARLKARDLGCEVVHEVARRCPLPINRGTTPAAQAWILHNQIAEELVAGSNYPIVVCDRSALDNYIYLMLSDPSPEVRATLGPLVDRWCRTYDLLIDVPIIQVPPQDGIRAADPGFQRQVQELLRLEVERRGLKTLRLPPDERPKWLDQVEAVVLERLRPAQLPLM